MAAGSTIKHKRKTSAFVGGELAAGEWGLNTNNGQWYFSADGTTVATVQLSLVSGTTIKTINGSSVLGSGNLTVSGTGLTQGQNYASAANLT